MTREAASIILKLQHTTLESVPVLFTGGFYFKRTFFHAYYFAKRPISLFFFGQEKQ
ncbi:MAG: hypothetical protein KDJ99_17220 [Candidatus Competibacteraceae bacterium]|nr:hypothetical protein [Candidatus Competibacteraceae bacterium]